MYNAKPLISSALINDSSLTALVPQSRIFEGSAKFNTQTVYPYIVYYELVNLEGQNADNEEIESDVTFRFDVYGTSSLSTIATHINRIIKSIGFTRNYFIDNDERLDTNQIIKHKIGSFSGNFII